MRQEIQAKQAHDATELGAHDRVIDGQTYWSSLTGMIPILHSPGLMMPGQLGPIKRVLVCSLMIFFTFTCMF
jgi:hypothetical protein